MEYFIITNNPTVKSELGGEVSVELSAGSFWDVLLAARDYVHRGHRLISHPLMGNIMPGDTPYRSLAIESKPHALDYESLTMIESAIEYVRARPARNTETPDDILSDYRLVDLNLLSNTISLINLN